MSRTLKRVLALTFVVALLFSMAVPSFATTYPNTDPQIVYMESKTDSGYPSYVSVLLASGDKNFTIKRTSVKLSGNTAGAAMTNFNKNYNSYSHSNWYLSGSNEWTENKNSNINCSYSVGLRVEKPGSVTVKYKIGTTTYSTKVTIKEYVNPIKSITLTGVNGGKTFASKTKNSTYDNNSLTLKKTTKSAKLVVKPNTTAGWKISSVYLVDETTGLRRTIGNYNKGMTSATISWGTLYATHNYYIDVELINTNGASMYVYYPVRGASAK